VRFVKSKEFVPETSRRMAGIIASQRIVLASRSPRRKELLGHMGLTFEVIVPEVDETPRNSEAPADLAARLCLAKASEVASARPDALIVAADTMVVLDGVILGKPSSAAQAHEMLARLRGRCHQVYSGLAVLDGERRALHTVVTPVYMRAYGTDEVRRYVASGDPMDKAGAYAIQHPEFEPVAKLEGCYANVMGLPMCHLYRTLRDWAMPMPVHPLRGCPHARQHGGCSWAAAILGDATHANDASVT